MNKLSDYILKYCSKEDIDYLIGIIGRVDGLDFNFNSSSARNILTDIKNENRFLTIFHNLYNRIVDEQIPISSEILSGIKVFDGGYFELTNRFSRLEDMANNNTVFSEDMMLDELKKRYSNLKRTLDNHPYREIASKVLEDRGVFSLNEEFDLEKGKIYPQDLNAVTVITPTQTISRFNSAKINDLLGSGNHDTNFREIVTSVYGRDFGAFGTSGQDIKIRYVNSARNPKSPFIITTEIPIRINSSQKKSLEILNEEIKKLELKTGINISINALIVDYDEGFHNAIPIEEKNNFDEVLKRVNVDDEFEYEDDIYLMGYPNNENHYNDSNFKLNESKEEFERLKDNYSSSNPNLRLVTDESIKTK